VAYFGGTAYGGGVGGAVNVTASPPGGGGRFGAGILTLVCPLGCGYGMGGAG
jgi:hypothetical protein